MERQIACEKIQEGWNRLSARWSADVKSRYFSQIYLPLLKEAEGMYFRNDALEEYAASCLSALGIYGGEGV